MSRDTDPADAVLAEGYRRCASLTWRYGTTYYWGAALLPKARRQHVHAVYALCRLADDIVDDQETVTRGDVVATRAAPTQRAERPGSRAMPVSARV